MFGQGFDSPQLHQRFEPRLKANQKTGSTAQVPLPFSLARPLPRSPLRSADGHRNRDAIVPRYLHISPSPIGNRYSVASLLSTPLSSTTQRKSVHLPASVLFCVVTLWGVHPCCLPSSSNRLHARAPRYFRIVTSPNLGARCKATPLSSTSASSRRSRGSIRKHLAVPYRRSLFRPRFARPYGLKRTKKQGVRLVASPYYCPAPCLPLRSVPPIPLRNRDAPPSSPLFRPRFARPYGSKSVIVA